MASVFLSNAYFYRFDPKQWKTAKPYPPLMTLGISSLLKEKNHHVDFFDTCLTESPLDILKSINSSHKYYVIYEDGFNYLTKMCLTKMREAAFDLIKIGKKNGCIVIINSSDATDHSEKYLDQGADYVVYGEGEETVVELIEKLERKSEINLINGIIYRENENLTKTPKRPVMKALDDLPMADWNAIDLRPYRNIWEENHGYFSLNIATTRGCPFKCNWCAKPIYGNRYNSRSPDLVLDEIELLIEKVGVEHIWMCDDIFGLKPGWVQEFNEQIQKRKIHFRYMIQSRVDLLLQEDTIEALANSGCEKIWVGAESGSQKILDAMDKGTKVEQIFEATEILKSKGIEVAFFLQFGYLGEESKDIELTIEMVKKAMPDDIGISVSYPLPGTKFYEMVKEDLVLKQNWNDSDDLDMMFNSTYSPAYYKRLHRYVHKEFQKAKGYSTIQKVASKPNLIFKENNWKKIAALAYYIPTSLIDNLQLRRLS